MVRDGNNSINNFHSFPAKLQQNRKKTQSSESPSAILCKSESDVLIKVQSK
jgi:hypothetical protein